MWLNGSPLLFYDSIMYIDQGQTGVERILGLIWPHSNGGVGANSGVGLVNGEAESVIATKFVRSIGYSAFAYVTSLPPLGGFGTILAQATIIAGVIGVLFGRLVLAQPLDALIALGVCIAVTPLPWFVSYLMPDILAAVPIVCGLIIVRGLEGVGRWVLLLLFAVTTFAAMSHYGHLPLALAVGLAALAVLLAQSRLTLAAVVLALAPTAVAGVVNMAGSQVAFEEVSVAPKRLPLLLARSILDGPARWHLEAHCPEQGYAMCEIFDTIADNNPRSLLWSIMSSTPEQLERIRQEETLILRRAFMEYPLQQTWSLARNSLKQFWTIGTLDITWGRMSRDSSGEFVRQDAGRKGLEFVAATHVASTLAAIWLIAFWAWRDGLRVGEREREMLFVGVVGFAVNAAIFGGLSAPADRYQSRVIWILPLLAALFWLARREARPGPARTESLEGADSAV